MEEDLTSCMPLRSTEPEKAGCWSSATIRSVWVYFQRYPRQAQLPRVTTFDTIIPVLCDFAARIQFSPSSFLGR